MEKNSFVSWLKPKNDFVFKLIFGSDNESSNELLIAFLNDVLNVPEGQSLASVEILNPIMNKESIDDKLAVLDIKARIIGYGYINIEIQLVNQKNIHKRSLYYCSKVFEEQLSEGDDYKKLARVVAINLIDFSFFTTDNYRSCFRFMEEDNGEPYPGLMQLHFFELSKFIEQEKECDLDVNDRMFKWLRFITNTDDTRWEEMAKQEPIIGKTVEKLRLASLDPEARMKYEAPRESPERHGLDSWRWIKRRKN